MFRLTGVFIVGEHLNCLVAMVTCVMGGHVMDCEGDQQFKRCRNWLKLDLRPDPPSPADTDPGGSDVMDNGITRGEPRSVAQSLIKMRPRIYLETSFLSFC